MSNRPPPYQPLKQTSDSPEPEWVANPQVQQPGYPPQQHGYPPQQPGYPPQQHGYPPQQHGYPPQQPGYPPQPLIYPPPQPYVQPVQVQTQVQVTTMMTSFGRSPVRTQCPNCKTEQMTRIRRRPGHANWAYCGIIALVIVVISVVGAVLLVAPLILLPFAFFGFIALCIPCLMNAEHSCPNCNYILGTSEH